MNLFRFHADPEANARAYPDTYTHNQVRESAQFLLTALAEHGADTEYGTTHENHPITLWAGRSLANWLDAYALTAACHAEYRRRYGAEKYHASFRTLNEYYSFAFEYLPDAEYTVQPSAMAEEFRVHDPATTTDEVIENYRTYLAESKSSRDFWTYDRADPPEYIRPYLK